MCKEFTAFSLPILRKFLVTEVKVKESFVCCHINIDVVSSAQSRTLRLIKIPSFHS